MTETTVNATPDEQSLIDWLSRHSPEERHFVANCINWDYAPNVLNWLISQPDCEKATAKLIFYLGSPDYFLQYENADAVDKFSLDNFTLLKTIVDRWNSGLYKRENVADDSICSFYPQYLMEQNRYKREKLPWVLSDQFGETISGKTVSATDIRDVEELKTILQRLGTFLK